MSNVISALLKAVFAAVKRVARTFVAVVKRAWWVVAIIAIIYFAPALAVWAAQSATTSWMVPLFNAVATNLTPALAKFAAWAAKAYASFGEWWEALGFWWKVAYTAGAMFLLAPEESQELAKEISSAVNDAVAGIGAAVGSAAAAAIGGTVVGLATSPVGAIAAAAAIWWLLARRRGEEEDEGSASSGASYDVPSALGVDEWDDSVVWGGA